MTVIVIILIFTSSLFDAGFLPTGSWGFQLKVFLFFARNVFVRNLVIFIPLSFLGYSQKVGQPDQTTVLHPSLTCYFWQTECFLFSDSVFFCNIWLHQRGGSYERSFVHFPHTRFLQFLGFMNIVQTAPSPCQRRLQQLVRGSDQQNNPFSGNLSIFQAPQKYITIALQDGQRNMLEHLWTSNRNMTSKYPSVRRRQIVQLQFFVGRN